jgi:hypothetical protein
MILAVFWIGLAGAPLVSFPMFFGSLSEDESVISWTLDAWFYVLCFLEASCFHSLSFILIFLLVYFE